MTKWTIICLALFVALTALGASAGRGASQSGAVGVALLTLGGSGAAVCLAVCIARALRRNDGRASVRRDSSRTRAHIVQLVAAAAHADTHGVLTLGECILAERNALFAEGVEMLIGAESPAAIRAALGAHAENETAAAHASRGRTIAALRVLPPVALSIALVTMVWMLVLFGRGVQPGSPMALGLLLTVYGAFLIVVVSSEISARAATATVEDELAGALVIETIIAIRAGEPPKRVEAILRELTPQGRPASERAELRRAA
jgi:chemotaxis protein MotA